MGANSVVVSGRVMAMESLRPVGESKLKVVVIQQGYKFSQPLAIQFWGDRAEEANLLRMDDMIEVDVNLISEEYQGRWYTKANAWRLELKNKKDEVFQLGRTHENESTF